MGLKYIYESKGNLVDRIMRVMLSVIKTVKNVLLRMLFIHPQDLSYVKMVQEYLITFAELS